MNELQWLDGTKQRMINSIAAGKDVYCEAAGPENPVAFTIYREVPATLRLLGGAHVWGKLRRAATPPAELTQFGRWLSQVAWQAPFTTQRLGAAKYRFLTGTHRVSPPLTVANKVAFVDERMNGQSARAAAQLALSPGDPALELSADASHQRRVNIAGTLFGIEDPVLLPRFIHGETLFEAAREDLDRWVAAGRHLDDGFWYDENALRWIVEAATPAEPVFSAGTIDLPEGETRLLRATATLTKDGPFAFALEMLDQDSGEVVATSDPIAGISESVQLIGRII